MSEGKKYFFFGAIDRRGNREDGDITSTYPAWTMGPQIEELQDEKEKLEGQLARGEIRYEDVMTTKERIGKLQKKHEMIISSKPKLEGATQNEVYAEYKRLTKNIQDSLFTRSDMEMSLANVNVEADRMVKPCIEVDPEIAMACGVKNFGKGNKISRNDAVVAWQILGKVLDPDGNLPTNVEAIRPDRVRSK